jgi:flagellar FliL protein
VEEENEQTQESPEPSRRFPFKAVVLGSIFLIFLGIAIWIWSSLREGSDTESTVQSAGAQTEKGLEFGHIFSMDPFVVNLSDPRGKRYLKTKIELEYTQQGVETELKARLPQLRDMILILLSSKRLEEIQDIEDKIALRNDLIMRINQILKRGAVRNLYFTEFVIQ